MRAVDERYLDDLEHHARVVAAAPPLPSACADLGCRLTDGSCARCGSTAEQVAATTAGERSSALLDHLLTPGAVLALVSLARPNVRPPERPRLGRWQRTLLRRLSLGPQAPLALRDAVGIQRNSVYTTLHRMRERGYVAKVGRKWAITQEGWRVLRQEDRQ